MAIGDILGITVRDGNPLDAMNWDGAAVDIRFAGLAIGGIAAAGKLALTIQYPGFDASGAVTSYAKTLTGLAMVRKPIYPNWLAATAFNTAARAFMAGGTATDARCSNAGRIYRSTSSGTTGTTAPTHTTGSKSDGGMTWTYVGKTADTATVIAGWIEAEQAASGGDVIVTFALNDWIFAGETITTVDIQAGLYTSGTASNALTSTANVVNGATLASPAPAGTVASPHWDHVQDLLYPEVYAEQLDAFDGRTLACVKFNVRDMATGAIVLTQTVAAMTASRWITAGNALPVYGPAIDVAGLADGKYCWEFEALPWRGLTTLKPAQPASAANKTGFGAGPAGLGWADVISAARTLHYNLPKCVPFRKGQAGPYAPVYAYVGAGAGVQAVSTNAASAATTWFPTMLAAANAIAAFNNGGSGSGRSHNDLTSGIIRLKAGTHNGTGGTMTSLGKGDAPLIIEGDPADANPKVNCLVQGSATAGYKILPKRVVLRNLGFTGATVPVFDPATDGASAWVTGTGFTNEIWCDAVRFNGLTVVTSSPLARAGNIRITNSSFPGWNTTLFNGNNRTICSLFAGNSCADGTSPLFIATGYLANKFNGRARAYNAATGYLDAPLDGINSSFRKIDTLAYAFNSVAAQTTQSKFGSNTLTVASQAIYANNLIEVLNGGTSKGVEFYADSTTTGTTATTVPWAFIRHNTIAGEGMNALYDENNANNVLKRGCLRFNIMDDFNVKADFYLTGGTSPYRVGNMPFKYHVGALANVFFAATDGNPSPKNQAGETLGTAFGWGTTLAPLVRGFALDASHSGSNAGGGDYTPTAASAAIARVPSGQAAYPFDLLGRPRLRLGGGAAGALERIDIIE